MFSPSFTSTENLGELVNNPWGRLFFKKWVALITNVTDETDKKIKRELQDISTRKSKIRAKHILNPS